INVDNYDRDDVNDDCNRFSNLDNYILKLLIKESKNPEITQFFANLTELILTIRERKYEIFSSLSLICYNIQKLIIRIDYPIYFYCGNAARAEVSSESYYLASLIRSQHNLVHFELFDIPETGINEILNSLKESQHNSLKTLILNNARINYNGTILSYMKYLQNLQELRFNKCLWLPNLKYLQVDYIDGKGEKLNELSLIISSILIRCSPLINISRDWCKETVVFLWRQPFHFLYTCNKINPSVFSRFTNSKQCHCSNEKRQHQAINLLMTYLLIKHDKTFVEKGIVKTKSKRITFDYFEFLFVLDLNELYCAIKDWNQWNNSNSKFSKDNYSPLTFE
ncbi:606_t:CDS:2, partial [Rhizophagus irregularis]